MAVKYTNIFHSKALQNIPKLVFWVVKINHLATLLCTFISSGYFGTINKDKGMTITS
jgi:hypothetical protein